MEIMKFLVVGLGSMGKRRVRNLQALGYKDIAGFDPREDRRKEAAEKYGIAIFDDVTRALDDFKPDALVVSTGPKYHMDYAWLAEGKGLHCFIEASVLEAERILALSKKNCRFRPRYRTLMHHALFPWAKTGKGINSIRRYR
jgi:predicted dehydrogenase